MYVSARSALRATAAPANARSSPCRRGCPSPCGRRGLRGLGLSTQDQTIASTASSALSVTGLILASSLAIPVIGPIAAGIAALGMTLAQVFSGCGQSCTQATTVVNQVDPLLKQNVTLYLGSPTRTKSMQAAALNNFDASWASVVQACQQIGGQGGAGCLSDRQQGACNWKTSPQGWTVANGTCTWTPPGPNGSGTACANWFTLYRDPIANDPCVQPDPSPVSSAATSVASALGIPSNVDFTGLLLPAALVGAGLLLFNGKN